MSTTTRWMTVAVAAGLMVRTAPAQRGASPADQQAVQQGMEALFQAFGGAGEQAPPAALIDHRELRAALPAELKGLKRATISSERAGAMGMAVSRAEARYAAAPRGSITIEISDLGGLGGFAAMAQMGWASADIDRETETGFERTAQYRGHKAMEEYDTARRSGKMQVLAGGRLMVEVSGAEVKFEDIRAAMDQLDLNKLAALKPVEPPK